MVVMLLKGTIESYALTHEYVGRTNCNEALEQLSAQWTSKKPNMWICRKIGLIT